jgi:hypothetical protein
MQTVGTVQKGKQRLAAMKLEQEELNRRIARENGEQHRRMGRLAENAGLFEANASDDDLLKGFRELAARFRGQGAAAAPAGDTVGDVAAATVSRSKGKSRDVASPAEG